MYNLSIKVFILLISSFFLFPTDVSAQVVINEFSSADTSDWVEIFNNSDSNIDLSNYSLTDGSESGNVKTFMCTLSSKGFLVIDWSNKLNNTGDIIYLRNNEELKDCVSYGDGAGKLCEGRESIDLSVIETNKFGARVTDGTGVWNIVSLATKENPNDRSVRDPSKICFTPTPIPEPTQAPTSAPTSTPTPSPTRTPTSTPTSTPKPTKTPTPKPSIQSSPDVLGDTSTDSSGLSVNEISLGLITPTSTPLIESEKIGKIPPYSYFIAGGGVIFLGLAVYSFFTSRKTSYNNSDGQEENSSKHEI
ncbi:hypothetical protein A2W13_00985 [Candidatus Woesebacteria bacterium RBG_16_36_11]|uniref:LTD domain-containing protein n=1 Tax=Candidatus Woesebacteria bacterium RBG_16_36_11 TaxID=1802481 RepID=A0A1F7X8D6_9BACT|nr:MAG: hypothetical protein A2W13_00985 [Candidatus Woesebacteria bacterium RBG_16_36_11]